MKNSKIKNIYILRKDLRIHGTYLENSLSYTFGMKIFFPGKKEGIRIEFLKKAIKVKKKYRKLGGKWK